MQIGKHLIENTVHKISSGVVVFPVIVTHGHIDTLSTLLILIK